MSLASALLPTKDRLGRIFDASRFKPKLDALGRWVNARAGRKPTKKTKQLSLSMSSDSTASAPVNPPPAEPSAETPPPAPPAAESPAPGATPSPAAPSFADIEKAAGPAALPAPGASGASAEGGEGEDAGLGMTTADSIIGIIQTALVLIGDDEGVLTRAEKLALRPPLERVLKKYNVGADVLPAEVDLAIALALIVVARLQKPKTATWFAKVRMWFGGKVAEHKGRALAHDVREAVKS